MTLNDYKEAYAKAKDYESWNDLYITYAEKGYVFRMDTAMSIIAEKYAADMLYEYLVSQLPPEQLKMYNALTLEWQRTFEIANKSEKLSGSVEPQLAVMMYKGVVLSKMEEHNGKIIKFWKRKRRFNDGENFQE